jgi:hypothetical protein
MQFLNKTGSREGTRKLEFTAAAEGKLGAMKEFG